MTASVPILRDLTPVGRIVVIVTLLISALSIVMEWVLHIAGTPVFVVSAAGILGLAYVVGISTERLGGLAGPQVGGILNATFGNIAELDHRVLRPDRGADRGGQGVAHRVDHRQPAARAGRQPAARRPAPWAPAVLGAQIASMDATLLVLAVIGLFVPAIFALSTAPGPSHASRRAWSCRSSCSPSTS